MESNKKEYQRYICQKRFHKELFSITGPFELIYKQTIVVNIKKEIIRFSY